MANQEEFVKRADAHIHLANEQMNDNTSAGEVSASFMYGLTRYNAWMAASGYDSAEEMAEGKAKVMEYFVEEYKKMLEEHLDNHIENHQFPNKWSY